MPNIECLIDSISQEITKNTADGHAWFKAIVLKHAYSQILLHSEAAKYCNLNLVSGEATGMYRFLTGFYGLTEMSAEFQKAIDPTLVGLTSTHYFSDNIFMVSKGSQSEHLVLVQKCLKKLNQKNFSIKSGKCRFLKGAIIWLGHHITQTRFRPHGFKQEFALRFQALSKLKRPKMQNS